MEGLIDLEIAGEMDRKYFLAFLKGLTQIKLKSNFAKVQAAKAKQRSAEDGAGEEENQVDLEYLYQNLFQQSSIQVEEFNTLADTTMRLISEMISLNMDKETLEKYLSRKVTARDDIKKAISMFWKQEKSKIIQALRVPTANEIEGIADIDWQIHLSTASRH